MKWRGKYSPVSISSNDEKRKRGTCAQRTSFTHHDVGAIGVNNTPAMIIKILLSARQYGERILRLFALIKIDYLLLTCSISSLLIKWFGTKSRILLLFDCTYAYRMYLPLNTNIKQSIFFSSPFIATFDQLSVITSHFVAYADVRVEHHPVIR